MAYDQTEFYCPNCGVKGIFIERGDGDYYLGVKGVCLSCNKSHRNAGNFQDVCKGESDAIQKDKLHN